MKVKVTGDTLNEWEHELGDAIVAQLGLSDEAIHTIRRMAQGEKIGFATAALRLGFLTQIQLDGIIAMLGQGGKEPHSGDAKSLVRMVASQPEPEPERSRALRVGNVVVPGPQLAEVLNPRSVRGDAVRALRTELVLKAQNHEHNGMLAVLSPGTREGRSLLAAELAICYAQLGRRTLLIDTDFRASAQHKLFLSSSEEWGLSQAIAFSAPLQAYDVEDIAELSVVFAGAPMPSPLEMLSDPAFHRMVARWRAEYEFVILDTPPLGQFADGLLLAKVAGRALMLSRTGHTRRADLKNALRRLATTGTHVVGSVLNSF